MNNKSLKELFEKQNQTFTKMVRLQEFCKAKPTTCQNDRTSRMKLLFNNYEKFCATNDEIDRIVHKEQIDTSNEKYFKEDLAIQSELLYYSLRDELDLPEDKAAMKPSASEPPSKDKQKHVEDEKIPEISSHKFSGEFTEWPKFRNKFLFYVHSKATFTSKQKLNYLKLAVTEEVFKKIKPTNSTNDESSYNEAWEKLENIFNKNIVVKSLFKKLLLQPEVNGSNESIEKLLETTQSCMEGLREMKVNTENWDMLLVHTLVQKLDESTKAEWIKSFSSDDEIPKLSQLFEFLKLKHPQSKLQSEPNSEEFFNKTSCECCEKQHSLWQCDKFFALSVEKRRQFVDEKKNVCVRCLASNHIAIDCWKAFKCQICSQPDHHFLLHKGRYE